MATYQVDFANQLDSGSKSLVIVDFAHHKIHDGEHYFFEEGIILGAAASREYLIVTPDSDMLPHLTIRIKYGLAGSAEFYEDTTKTGGTSLTPRNRNRSAGDLSPVTLTHTPSGTGDGTLLFDTTHGSTGGGPNSSGGENRGESEIMLKPNSSYLFRVTSAEADNRITVLLNWYEQVPNQDVYFTRSNFRERS